MTRLLLCLLLVQAGQVAPPAQTGTPAPVADALIYGRVVDPSGAGVSAATVALQPTTSGVAPPPRVLTDDEGRYFFDRLTPGPYLVNVTKIGWVASLSGKRRVDGNGHSITLAEHERKSVDVTTWKLGAVSGTLVDEAGEPIVDVEVRAVRRALISGQRQMVFAGTARTDDRGVYRIFGVPPGRYFVAAVPLVAFGGSVAGHRTAEEIDAIFEQLQQRVRNAAVSPPPDKRVEPLALGPATTFATVIFPGTTRVDSATPVTLASGEERTGIDFVMTNTRVGAIEGTVSGGVANLDRVELNLMFEGPQFPLSGSSRPLLVQPPDRDGRFRYENILPGRFSIIARATGGEGDPEAAKPIAGAGSASGAGSSVGRMRTTSADGDDFIYGRAEVDVNEGGTGQVSISLAPGATMSGAIALDQAGTSAPDFAKFTVQVLYTEPVSITINNNTAIGNQFMGLRSTPFQTDGSWRLRGVPPGAFTLFPFVQAPLTTTWWLRSAMLNGRDLLDGPFDVQAGQDLSGIVLTFTDRHSELSGTLTTAAGRAATDYFIIVCPTDPKLWTPGSRRVKSLRPASDGSFSVKDLPAGDYVIAALTDVAPGEWNDPAWLAAVAPAGAPVKITDGGKTIQNLRVGGS